MRTELQIIDALEALRQAFAAANPDWAPDPALAHDEPALAVVEAWVVAMTQQPAPAGESRRRLRQLARALRGEQANLSRLSAREESLFRRQEPLGRGLAEAHSAGLWPLNGARPPADLTELLAAWREHLPGLSELRGWRFLSALGLPVLTPERPMRRFLWRFGLVESGPDSPLDAAGLQSEVQQLARLSGIDWPLLKTVLGWHCGEGNGLKGGAWCAATPRCGEGCPLKSHCPWARFRPEGAPAALRPTPVETPPVNLDAARRRLAQGKADQIEDLELLALLLGNGPQPWAAAEGLMRRFGELHTIQQATPEELCEVPGISIQRALQLLAALELGRRSAMRGLGPGEPITGSAQIWAAYRTRFRHLPQEHFVVVMLDARNRVIDEQIVSKGTLTGSLAHPREVFRPVVRLAASAVILLHNHPSGDPAPSPEDRALTHRLREAGEVLGIRVLDHIVLGAENYYSFADDGAV